MSYWHCGVDAVVGGGLEDADALACTQLIEGIPLEQY
jgi:hypothetical protein